MPESTPPVIDFTAYVADRARGFAGRDWLLRQLDEWLADPAGPRFFLLTGEPGAGKTAVATRLAQFSAGTAQPPPGMSRIRPGFLGAMHFCSVRDLRWIIPQVFVESLTRQLADRYDGYALAVLRSVAPTMKIDVVVRENWGRVIGAEIGTLVITATPAEDVFDRLVREPLEALSRVPTDTGAPEQIVILVDALDEALTYSGKVTIADLVAQTDNLPANVRFVLTGRPSNELLRSLRRRNPVEVTLSPGRSASGDVLHDVQDYLAGIVDAGESPLRERLDLPVEEFVATVRDRSEGNFLYVRHLLLALSGRITAESLAAAPTGLDQIYLEFLQRLSGNDLDTWHAKYGKVLGILAVAQVPLTELRIADFTGLPFDDLRPVLARIRQLLETEGAEDDRTYALYHRSFGEFLVSRPRAEDYWVNHVSMHQRIARYYLDNFSSDWQRAAASLDPRTVVRMRYGLRNLATHLYQAGLDVELQKLINEDWIKARHRRRNYSYDGVVNDIEVAWRAVGEQNRRALAEGTAPWVGQEIRWALCVSSIASLVRDIPPDVLAALVGSNLWSVDQGLAYARRTPAGEHRSKALAGLAPHLPNPAAAYQEAMAAADQITELKLRAAALTSLLPLLPVELRREGFNNALNVIGELSDQRRVAGGYSMHYGSGDGERFVETGDRSRAEEALAEVVGTLLDPAQPAETILARLRSDHPEQLADGFAADVVMNQWQVAEGDSAALMEILGKRPEIGDTDLLDQVSAAYGRAAPPPELEVTEPVVPAQLPEVLETTPYQSYFEVGVRLEEAGRLTGDSQQDVLAGILAGAAEHGWPDYASSPVTMVNTLPLVTCLPESEQRTKVLDGLARAAIDSAKVAHYGRGYPGWNFRHRIVLLLALFPHLPEPYLSEAAQAVLRIVIDDYADRLSEQHTAILAWYLPESLLEVAEAAITEVPLPSLMPSARLPAALAVARKRKNKDWLLAITRRLTGPPLIETLEVAEEIGGAALRAELLGRCAANYLTLDPTTLYDVWSAGLRGLANLSRGNLLELLRRQQPIVAALDGNRSLFAVQKAVEDVRKWWP